MINEEVIKSIKEKFGLEITESLPAHSYFTRVWEIVTDGGERLILKLLPDFYRGNIFSYRAVIAVCDLINEKISDFKTIRHIKDQKGEVVQEWKDGHFYVLMEKQEMAEMSDFTPQRQQQIGHLMWLFHTKLKNFSHPGLGGTRWMRKIDEKSLPQLQKAFPDRGYLPYLEFTQRVDYKKLNLELTTIHGDWHGGNMSFTSPPFLFDYDTLSKGSAVEDIARTLSHWEMDNSQRKVFFDNFLTGYPGLSENEKNLIPRFIIATLYANYLYYLELKDFKNAQLTKEAIPVVKKAFSLP